MQQNPKLKEKVYVHTNKTSYFPDDVIWFKAYVGDSINYPSVRTKILEVRLFDDNGNQMFARDISISEGTGSGQFELSDSFAPGTYYLQARTNYMRNFGEVYQYLQEITILGQIPSITSTEKHKKYDVQLLPESGNLIEGIENVLGIKALLNGRSIDFQGDIIDGKGETVTTFKSEHEGMGRCSFFYKKGEAYRAKIQLLDTLLVQDVPTALAKGVSLSVDNSDEEILKVYLKTNEGTFYDQVYSNYTLLYRQDRQLFQLVSVARLDSINGLLETDKNIFMDGVHTVTLFADDRPIAERKFHIETERKKTAVSLERSSIDNDSITYRLSLKGKEKNLEVDLSVAILQKNSEVADMENTVKSAFLLTPYVRGKIENPAYYLDPENEKRKEHLDLLLLTQGWTRYNLYELIKEISPIEKYAFETGFELKGRLKEETKYKNLVLIPDDLRVVDKIRLNEPSDFVFKNLEVFKGDTVRVAYQNWLGKIIKPSNIEYDTTYIKNISSLKVPERFENHTDEKEIISVYEKTKNYGATLKGIDTPLRNLDGTIDLDEVIVTEKKRSERYLQRRKVIEKYKPVVHDIGKYYDMPIPEVYNNSNSSLMVLLASQRFVVRTDNNREYFLGGDRTLAYLFINGRPIQPAELPTLHLRVKDIENYMVNNLGYNPAIGKSISIIQVFTSDTFGQNKNKLFDRFVIKNGYDRAKKYYTPMYIFDRSRPASLLEVDWKPLLKTDKKGEISFKIAKDDKAKGLLLSIQGFSNKGHLISKTILTD